jgi:hypothetical protein
MSAAKINGTTTTVLDGKASADEVVTEADVQDAPKLARMLVRLLATVADMRRAFSPRRIDFEDVAVSTAGAQVALQHNFGGRVRWWIVGWTSSGTSAPILRELAPTAPAAPDPNTLYLQSYVAGTACIRVEGAG